MHKEKVLKLIKQGRPFKKESLLSYAKQYAEVALLLPSIPHYLDQINNAELNALVLQHGNTAEFIEKFTASCADYFITDRYIYRFIQWLLELSQDRKLIFGKLLANLCRQQIIYNSLYRYGEQYPDIAFALLQINYFASKEPHLSASLAYKLIISHHDYQLIDEAVPLHLSVYEKLFAPGSQESTQLFAKAFQDPSLAHALIKNPNISNDQENFLNCRALFYHYCCSQENAYVLSAFSGEFLEQLFNRENDFPLADFKLSILQALTLIARVAIQTPEALPSMMRVLVAHFAYADDFITPLLPHDPSLPHSLLITHCTLEALPPQINQLSANLAYQLLTLDLTYKVLEINAILDLLKIAACHIELGAPAILQPLTRHYHLFNLLVHYGNSEHLPALTHLCRKNSNTPPTPAQLVKIINKFCKQDNNNEQVNAVISGFFDSQQEQQQQITDLFLKQINDTLTCLQQPLIRNYILKELNLSNKKEFLFPFIALYCQNLYKLPDYLKESAEILRQQVVENPLILEQLLPYINSSSTIEIFLTKLNLWSEFNPSQVRALMRASTKNFLAYEMKVFPKETMIIAITTDSDFFQSLFNDEDGKKIICRLGLTDCILKLPVEARRAHLSQYVDSLPIEKFIEYKEFRHAIPFPRFISLLKKHSPFIPKLLLEEIVREFTANQDFLLETFSEAQDYLLSALELEPNLKYQLFAKVTASKEIHPPYQQFLPLPHRVSLFICSLKENEGQKNACWEKTAKQLNLNISDFISYLNRLSNPEEFKQQLPTALQRNIEAHLTYSLSY